VWAAGVGRDGGGAMNGGVELAEASGSRAPSHSFPHREHWEREREREG